MQGPALWGCAERTAPYHNTALVATPCIPVQLLVSKPTTKQCQQVEVPASCVSQACLAPQVNSGATLPHAPPRLLPPHVAFLLGLQTLGKDGLPC